MKTAIQFRIRCFTLVPLLAALLSPFLARNVFATCVAPPAGLVSWWRGETNALDQAGTNHGALVTEAGYTAGRVGQAFAFDGAPGPLGAGYVGLGNPASLHLQDLTIETWLRRTSATAVSVNGNGSGFIFGFNNGGYGLYLDSTGSPTLSKIGVSATSPAVYITDTNLHHLAVTKVGSTVVFYLDGVAHPVSAYNPGFTFSDNAYIGGLGRNLTLSGVVDELSVYSRALAANEILAIYNAGSDGKCVPAVSLVITSQPADQTVTSGDTATFNVTALGTATLNYQWRLNTTNITGATADFLVLPNVQLTDAGVYSVVVSNSAGTVTSSNATLTVNAASSCTAPPSGLVSWWRGETNALDQAGTNNGTLAGDTTYGVGQVGQGFVFDGNGAVVQLGNPASLHLQDLTIETWIRRASSLKVSHNGNGLGVIFGFDIGGYGLYMDSSGIPVLTDVGISEMGPAGPFLPITDTNLHHLAVTKGGSTVVFYVDGVAHAAQGAYDPGFVFTNNAFIGGLGNSYSFYGTVDEVSVYNRPLSAGEIQAIYSAGSDGKCVSAVSPAITSQPADQMVTGGSTATFNVTASGTTPLNYQWRLNTTNIVGATADSLVLPNVQLTNAGVYSVVVSNSAGTVTSSNATLTVNAPASCIAPPSGLVSWWRGESNALDQVGANDGNASGNLAYGGARVGQGFVFDGNGAAVLLGNPASMHLQDLTIETWLRRTSATVTSLNGNGNGVVFGYYIGGYGIYLDPSGTPTFSKIGVNAVAAGVAITDTSLHHLAVTKVGSTVVFYVDGVAYPAAPYAPGFTFSNDASIGGLGNNYSFYGTVDEVSIYNRSLTASEIKDLFDAGDAGKCVVPIPAFIVTQPANQAVLVGGTATFNVTGGGTPPFSYQWWFNGTSLTNATNATLTLPNVQYNQAGNYAVTVSNAASLVPVSSSNATLTVTYPPANVRVGSTNMVSGHPVTVPVIVAANGNENALSFSLNYTTARLNFNSAQLGNFPSGTYFFVNTSQTNLGRLGVTVALPSGATFAPGTQLLAGITFDATILLAGVPITTPVSFGDAPAVRGLTDVNALTLAATYTSGSVTLSATELEGDASPRPGGDRSFTINDWVQAGRFAARLDLPAAGGEFQRADSAPRGTQGDGQITVADWVQTGRYFAGLDPLTAVGGPTLEVTLLGPLGPDALREVRVAGTNAIQNLAVTLPVTLQSQGNENGVGFTVSFDAAAFNYVSASLGSGAVGANFNLNTNQVLSGKLGLVLVLPTGNSFAAGLHEIAQVSLLPNVAGSYPVTLSDQLVLRGVSDPAAIELPASYVAGMVIVNPHPTLLITQVDTNVTLAWPALASGFNLQSSTNTAFPGGWADLPDVPQPVGGNLTVSLPLSVQTTYFRLRHP